jgi:hypothetical protein
MDFKTFSPQLLVDCIAHELKKTDDAKMASILALKRLKKDPKHYEQFGIFESQDMQKAKNNNPENGTIKLSTRKGKKAMVFMDGKWFHFGDSKMKHNYSDEAREAATARHKKNLEGNDSRAKAFRVYWKKYWKKGGKVKNTDERTDEDMLKAFFKQFDKKTGKYKYLKI